MDLFSIIFLAMDDVTEPRSATRLDLTRLRSTTEAVYVVDPIEVVYLTDDKAVTVLVETND